MMTQEQIKKKKTTVRVNEKHPSDHILSIIQGGGAVTHHSGEAGDERDAVLHLLLGDLQRRAVLLLQRKRVRAVLSHPRVQLKPTEIL